MTDWFRLYRHGPVVRVPFCPIPLGTYRQFEYVKLHGRAALAMHASIMFWVGACNLLSESLHFAHKESWILMEASLERELLYLTVGILLLLVTDTLYGNAGLPGSYLRDMSHWKDTRYIVVRTVASLIGSVLAWTGMYNLLDLHVWHNVGHTLSVEELAAGEVHQHTASVTREITFLVVGIVGLLFITRTFFEMALVEEQSPVNDTPHSKYSFEQHLAASARALLSLLFQTCVWCGGYNLLQLDSHASIWRELCYLFGGIYLMMITDTFVPNSWIVLTETLDFERNSKVDLDLETPSVGRKQENSVFLYAQAFAALAGQIVHNTGTWVLLDYHLSLDSVERNFIYIIVSMIILLMTGVLLQNAGVYPPEDDQEIMLKLSTCLNCWCPCDVKKQGRHDRHE
jgi:hypothetical protein